MSGLTEFVFKVEMTCEGCSNAMTKILVRHKESGVDDFTVDLPTKTVILRSYTLSSGQAQAIVAKGGKVLEQVV